MRAGDEPRAHRPLGSKLALLLALGALVLCTASAAGAFPRLGLELGAQGHRVSHGSWDLVDSGDRWSSFSPSLGVALTPRLALWLGYQYGGSDAGILGGRPNEAELTVHQGDAWLVYSVPLTSWLQPYARMGGGMLAGRVELSLAGGEQRAQWGYEPVFALGGGLLLTPPGLQLSLREQGLLSAVSFGLRADAGYQVAGGLELDELASSGGPGADAGSVARPALSLGTLVLDGWTWRLALAAFF